MSIESITEKIAMTKRRNHSLVTILFSKDTKVATFFYIPANANEARGVANGLPCFLESVMKIKDPSIFAMKRG